MWEMHFEPAFNKFFPAIAETKKQPKTIVKVAKSLNRSRFATKPN